MTRIIALHAQQTWRGGGKRGDSYVLLSEDEAERLENALRLARTGKLDKERPVPTATEDTDYPGNCIVRTRFVVKGYDPATRRTP